MSRDDGIETPGVPPEALERISEGILAVDEEHRYTYLNGRAAQILGVDRDAMLGVDLWEGVPESGLEGGRDAIERATETETAQSFQWVDPTSERCYDVRVYPDDTGLSLCLEDVTRRKRRVENLSRLHEATREMFAAETRTAVAELVSQAAVEILDLPVNAVHFYETDRETLVPVARSEKSREILETAPALDSGLAWDAYQSGTVMICPDLSVADNVYNATTAFESELFVPLGEYGVFIVSSTEPDAFEEVDVTLAKLLGANGTVALDQVTNESRLAKQRDNLELLTRMMSHDIRNDLQVVGAVAEVLGDQLGHEYQEYIEKIRRNTTAAVDLTTSAQELTAAMLRPDTTITPMALRQTLNAQINEVRATASGASITTDSRIPALTVRADDLLGSVFRNVLKNAIQHNDADVPEVTVSVEHDDDNVWVRISDNGPGVPDERKEEIFGRGEKGMSSHGTGIGLYLVQTLTEQYGGRVWVEDNDPRGAVFVIKLELA